MHPAGARCRCRPARPRRSISSAPSRPRSTPPTRRPRPSTFSGWQCRSQAVSLHLPLWPCSSSLFNLSCLCARLSPPAALVASFCTSRLSPSMVIICLLAPGCQLAAAVARGGVADPLEPGPGGSAPTALLQPMVATRRKDPMRWVARLRVADLPIGSGRRQPRAGPGDQLVDVFPALVRSS